jgi:hypothetical protein
MRRHPRVGRVLVGVLLLLAVPLAVSGVDDEASLRAAVNNSGVSEVVMTADITLTNGQLTFYPGRNLTLRGACGGGGTGKCTLDAAHASRLLFVKPGAHVRVSNVRLVNGSSDGPIECSPLKPASVTANATGCVPEYYGFGVWLGYLYGIAGRALSYVKVEERLECECVPRAT